MDKPWYGIIVKYFEIHCQAPTMNPDNGYKLLVMFCYVVFTILNLVTKRQTPSRDKHSATESKACGLHKFWILCKKPDLFWFNMTGSSTKWIFPLIWNYFTLFNINVVIYYYNSINNILSTKLLVLVFIPNRTFLVRFGGISGEFGRAMVRILARRSRAKIPMVRPNEHDMLPKRTKKGAIRYLPYPNSS